jgi:hypothetical protein
VGEVLTVGLSAGEVHDAAVIHAVAGVTKKASPFGEAF